MLRAPQTSHPDGGLALINFSLVALAIANAPVLPIWGLPGVWLIDAHILFEKQGALGLMTLNRPKALNALTHGMCMGLTAALEAGRRMTTINGVAIRGAGARAFCAGGDIRAM